MKSKEQKRSERLRGRIATLSQKKTALQRALRTAQDNQFNVAQVIHRLSGASLGISSRTPGGSSISPKKEARILPRLNRLRRDETKFRKQIEFLEEKLEPVNQAIEAAKEEIKTLRTGKKSNPTPAQLRARRKFAAMARKRARLAKKGNPGKRGLKGATAKQERQYEHIKKSERKSGRTLKAAKRIAAATVRKRANKTIIKAKRVKIMATNGKRKRNAVVLPRLTSTLRGEYDPARLRKQRDQLRANIQSYAALIKKLTKEIQGEKSPLRVTEIRRQLKDIGRLEQREVSQLDRVLTALGATEGIPRRAFKNKSRKARKRNPSVSSKSRSNFQKFHGRPSRKSVTVLAPKGTPQSVAISGPLKSIRTRKVTLNFMKRRNPGSEAMLAEGDNGQLYIVAKGDHLPHGPEPLTDYGPIEQVEYIAKKPHLGYPETTEFYHKFGEETGVRPHLETNEQGEYIITGGEYYVTDRGIENPRRRKRTVRRRR